MKSRGTRASSRCICPAIRGRMCRSTSNGCTRSNRSEPDEKITTEDTEEIQREMHNSTNSKACHTVFAALGLLLLTTGCGGNGSSSTMPPGPLPEYKIIDLAPGAGASPHAGDRITVNYTGWLYDASKPDNKGKQFD